MTVPFNRIPSNIRAPGFFAEIDASKANGVNDPGTILVMGPMLASGTAAAGVPVPVASKDDARAKAGVGSILAKMIAKIFDAAPLSLVWMVPIADAAGSTPATGTLTVTAAPTAPGVIPLYVAGVSVPVPVNGTETVTTCAAEIVAAVNALSNLPVTAANVNGIVTFTARNKGTLGNAIDLRFAWLGAIGGETLPTSFAATIVAMAGGATDPTVTAAFAALGDQLFDYIVQPWTDAGNLNACQAAMGFTGGRWSWNRMVWGMVFTAYSGTLSQAQTLGLTRNDPFTSILPVDPASPTPIWEWLASAIAVTAVALGDDPARPIQGIEIPNVLSPPPGTGRVTLAGRNTLLYSGMSCFEVGDDGVSRISRLVSTYQTNQFGQNDIAYLSVEKNFTLMASLRDLRTQYNADFPRFKLAHDGTRAGLAKQVVTPSLLYAWLVARMRWQEEEMGWLDDVDAMIPNIDVEINAQNPDRADMIFPPPLIGQLRDLAVLAQFRVNNS